MNTTLTNAVITSTDNFDVFFETPMLSDDSLMHLCQLQLGSGSPPDVDKVQALIRIDEDVLTWFKSRAFALKNQGSFCQLINDALREYASQIEHQKL